MQALQGYSRQGHRATVSCIPARAICTTSMLSCPSRSLAFQCSVVICRPFDPPACARISFHLLAIAVYSPDLASCESVGRVAGQTNYYLAGTGTGRQVPWSLVLPRSHRARSRAVSLRPSKGLGNLHALPAWSSHTVPVPFLSQSLVPNSLRLATRATARSGKPYGSTC